MFNKKTDGANNPNVPGSGVLPAAPPQMRKPSSIAPLPPKRKDMNVGSAGNKANPNSIQTPELSDDVTFISNDISITGSIVSNGEVVIEGNVEGDVRAQKIIVRNNAIINGEVISEELIIHGRVNGTARGIKILLASDCILNGDILHETLSIESGAQFEGSCKRSDAPLADYPNAAAPSQKSALIKPLAEVEIAPEPVNAVVD